jgi:CARDB
VSQGAHESPFAMLPLLSFFEEFDFDDEPPRRERRLPRLRLGGRVEEEELDDHDEPPHGGGGGGGGRGGGPRRSIGGGVQWQRIGLLALALVVLALVGYWQLTSCQRSAEVKSYKNYVTAVNDISRQADANGKELATAILKQGQTPTGIETSVLRIAQSQAALVAKTQALKVPGGMSQVHPFLIEAQKLRANGLAGMAKALKDAFASVDRKAQSPTVASDKVAAVSLLFARVLAGDIVFSDSYQGNAQAVLGKHTIRGASIDASQMVDVKNTLQFIDPGSLGDLMNGIASLTTQNPNQNPAGPHGTGIDGAAILPANTALDPGSTTSVTAATGGSPNQFAVTVKNTGCCVETSIQVRGLLDGKVLGTQTIPLLQANTTATVKFNFTPLFGVDVHTLQADVDKVPGETRLDNNKAVYKVRFKLGGA